MPKSKRPKGEVVKFIIKEILASQKVRTQTVLAELVLERLNREGESYNLSGGRVRSLAAQIPGIGIQTETRGGPAPKKCPCCSHTLKKRFTKNLYGKKLLIRIRCPRCGYTGSENKWAPRRYLFYSIKE